MTRTTDTTRQPLSAARLPSQAEVDAAIARGRRLRSRAFLDAVSALFAPRETRPVDRAYGNAAR